MEPVGIRKGCKQYDRIPIAIIIATNITSRFSRIIGFLGGLTVFSQIAVNSFAVIFTRSLSSQIQLDRKLQVSFLSLPSLALEEDLSYRKEIFSLLSLKVSLSLNILDVA